jgi:hypothetical protein
LDSAGASLQVLAKVELFIPLREPSAPNYQQQKTVDGMANDWASSNFFFFCWFWLLIKHIARWASSNLMTGE